METLKRLSGKLRGKHETEHTEKAADVTTPAPVQKTAATVEGPKLATSETTSAAGERGAPRRTLSPRAQAVRKQVMDELESGPVLG